jgi:hypothetical protein
LTLHSGATSIIGEERWFGKTSTPILSRKDGAHDS